MKTKFYLYRLLEDINTRQLFFPGIQVSGKWKLLGLDRRYWRDEKIRSLSNEISLRQFEVMQRNFDLFLNLSTSLKVRINKLVFSDELDEGEHDELVNILHENNPEKLMDFISYQRLENSRDLEEVIFSLTQIEGYNNIAFSRDAVLTVDLGSDDIEEVLSLEPIGLLSGLYEPIAD